MFRSLLVALLVIGSSADLYLPRLPLSILLKGDVELVPRIVGGTQAADGEFPWQVSLQRTTLFGTAHYCGGTIVNADSIITASHCLDGFVASQVYAVAGEYRLNSDSGNEQKLQAARLIMHDNYDSVTIYNDIGIVKLKSAFILDDKVTPVTLPASEQVTAPGTVLTVTGWGTTSENGVLANTLMKVNVPAISDSDCRSVYGSSTIDDTMICAGFDQGGADACQGDSGGPLVNAAGQLVGVVSWGYGCARPGFPGVYTEVSYFIDWLNQHL